jgi:serine/alanine racemase
MALSFLHGPTEWGTSKAVMTVVSNRNYVGLDYGKIVAAIVVIAIHTGLLLSYNDYTDFLLTRILARLAEPFFFMVSGFLLFRKLQAKPGQAKEIMCTYASRVGLIYLIAILINVPVSIYAGHYVDGVSMSSLLSDLIFNGTFYHLWFLPALIMGVYVVYLLSRKLSRSYVLLVTGLLYVIGLFGDSYYGLIERVAVIHSAYNTLFSLFDYTRNGLFFAPLFIALGLLAAQRSGQQRRTTYAIFFGISMGLLFVEGMLVRSFELPRHDSMYIFLLPAVYALFRWLLLSQGREGVYVRQVSLWLYMLHPLAIVLVRGMGEWTGLRSVMIGNSLIFFVAVTLLSWMLAVLVVRVRQGSNPKPLKSRAWREINLAHLEHNVWELKGALPADCQLMAIVKADAYGHGSIEVARHLNKVGVRYYAVAEISEGIALRKNGVKGDILILGQTCESHFGELVKYRLQQTVISAEYGDSLQAFGRKINVHIKIDTGMNRLGECCDNVERVLSMYRHTNLRVIGTYSHLAVSDSLDNVDIESTLMQINRFNQIIGAIKSVGIDPGILHIQSSYGIVNYPDISYGLMNYTDISYGMINQLDVNFGLARPGIALYGLLSNGKEVKTKLQLRPVLSLRAKVVLVKNVCANRPIGYGCDCLTAQDSRIATISIGYADGIPRELSNNGGYVLIRGQKAKIMGKICMDHLMVDVTHIGDVMRGDIATLIGQDGEAIISAEQVAEQCGTITNEILSRIGSRVERVYI